MSKARCSTVSGGGAYSKPAPVKVLESLKCKVESGKSFPKALRHEGNCHYEPAGRSNLIHNNEIATVVSLPRNDKKTVKALWPYGLNALLPLKKAAFTLAEMMVVLLIMSIALAIMAPSVTRKISHNHNKLPQREADGDQNNQIDNETIQEITNSITDNITNNEDFINNIITNVTENVTNSTTNNFNEGPWYWTNPNNKTDAYFWGNGANARAVIGKNNVNARDNAKLTINTGENSPYAHILFKNKDTVLGALRLNSSSVALSNTEKTDIGIDNVALGVNALKNNRSYHNTAVGANALQSLNHETKGKNTAVGAEALKDLVSSELNTAIGYSAMWKFQSELASVGGGNTAVGAVALDNAIKADFDTAVGSYALYNFEQCMRDKHPSSNTAVGSGALYKNKDGYENIALGSDANYKALHPYQTIAIGSHTYAEASGSIAIGSNYSVAGQSPIDAGAKIDGDESRGAIAIGSAAVSKGLGAIALGSGVIKKNKLGPLYANPTQGAQALEEGAIAIGGGMVEYGDYNTTPIDGAVAKGKYSIAIGTAACNGSTGNYVTCIGVNSGPVNSANNNEMWLGDRLKKYTKLVVIPSKLEVYGSVEASSFTQSSDRRLKNVGKEFTSGLDKIKQLKVFNYTFKKDEKKTPHVGVIAQDLQKVFPDAINKDDDGYLTIRMEDMFYALINAVKELDAKVTAVLNEVKELKTNITVILSETKDLKTKNAEILRSAQNDRKLLKQVQSDNKALKARLDKLETKMK